MIMPSISPPNSGTAASVVGGLESVGLLTAPPGPPPSSPSLSPPRESLALRFFKERSLPMGPGLYSLVSTGSISGSWGDKIFTFNGTTKNKKGLRTVVENVQTLILQHGQITFCVLIGPARGCFCRCSLGAGSLFSEAVSNNAETPSLSVLPADDGAPN